MSKIAERKELVYRDQELISALAILRSRRLAINATHRFWSITSEGTKHPRKGKPGQFSVIAKAKHTSSPSQRQQIAGSPPCCPLAPSLLDIELPRTLAHNRGHRDLWTSGSRFGGRSR
jgi:hypothetical protein